ncbi:prolipoprotein diacylglyceryl transferase [Corynebacterium suranareeae]|uniref:Phosphatidylglycerol--prolipoprotein diacylglyceryl transferase n=1 Tax=Corynebacterium suranareeae TaxID=2506452 RepID=A0A160PS30_9CORY|nr:prolipoprotein diacylglyceryl transferase [Corynebacterium suranareeae]BAU96425.1 prolipoprotein diacylglyceryl transferase [Corynebacterium suranareeae]
MTLAAIPSPPQGVWYLGPIPIRAYAMCIIAGIIVAIWLTRKRYAARGGNPEMVLDVAIVAVPAGIIGGRIYHVITDNQKYFCDTCNPVDALKITNGGLGIWGAVILGGLAVAAYFRYKKLPLAPFADAVAPGVILAQGIGRLGNWFNQELYGAETTVPWALEIYYRVDENGKFSPVSGTSTGEIMATVHPTFLYELLWNLLIFALLMWADKRFKLGHGRVFALYVAGYTLGRFWIEQMRVDEATLIGGIRINTIVSAVVFAGAVIVFFILKKGRETPEVVDPTYFQAQAQSGEDGDKTVAVAGKDDDSETPPRR